jgi:AAA+ ATPase superfamily predicted ATPase
LLLVFGCALNCEKKDEFIKVILKMNSCTQNVLALAIQEVFLITYFLAIKFNKPNNFFIKLMNRIQKNSNSLFNENFDNLKQQIHELKNQELLFISEIEILKSHNLRISSELNLMQKKIDFYESGNISSVKKLNIYNLKFMFNIQEESKLEEAIQKV